MTKPIGIPDKLPATSDVVQRARQALDAWPGQPITDDDRRVNAVIGSVTVAQYDLVRELADEVERLEADRDTGFRQRMGEHTLRAQRDQARTEAAKLRAIIDRVRAIHQRGPCACGNDHYRTHIGPDCDPICTECGPGDWPCLTRRALDGEV